MVANVTRRWKELGFKSYSDYVRARCIKHRLRDVLVSSGSCKYCKCLSDTLYLCEVKFMRQNYPKGKNFLCPECIKEFNNNIRYIRKNNV